MCLNGVEVEVGPLGRPKQLGYVPGPDLARFLGQELRSDVCRVGELVAPFPGFAALGEQAIHGPLRAEVTPLVEEGGVDLGHRGIPEALTVELGENRRSFGLGERAGLLQLGLGFSEAPPELGVLYLHGGCRMSSPRPREGLERAIVALPAPFRKVGTRPRP
jgi:hypothetical protein